MYVRKYDGHSEADNSSTDGSDKVKEGGEHLETVEQNTSAPKRHAWARQLRPWSFVNPEVDLVPFIWRPFTYLAVPVVLWVILVYGIGKLRRREGSRRRKEKETRRSGSMEVAHEHSSDKNMVHRDWHWCLCLFVHFSDYKCVSISCSLRFERRGCLRTEDVCGQATDGCRLAVQAPPYNWSEINSGLVAIANMVGYFLAIPLVWVSDWWAAKQTVKNGGIREAEMRLTPLLVPLLIGPAGMLVYGLAAQNQLHWFAYFAGVAMR